MFRNRRLACAILGMWMGAGVSVDLLVTENFFAIDRFVAAPGTAGTAARISQVGPMNLLFLLRRNATEESAGTVQFWEWMQIGLATAFFFMILLGERHPQSALMLILAILSIVLLQRFVLTPRLTSLGRDVDEISAAAALKNPTIAAFQFFRGFYMTSEGVKLLLGIGLLSRFMVRRERRSASEPGPEPVAVTAQPNSQRGGRRRRTTDRNG